MRIGKSEHFQAILVPSLPSLRPDMLTNHSDDDENDAEDRSRDCGGAWVVDNHGSRVGVGGGAVIEAALTAPAPAPAPAAVAEQACCGDVGVVIHQLSSMVIRVMDGVKLVTVSTSAGTVRRHLSSLTFVPVLGLNRAKLIRDNAKFIAYEVKC